MTRALIIIRSDADRAKAAKWCAAAPENMRIEFKAAKRSLAQNDRLWAMLSDIAAQKQHNGRKYDAESWKSLFLHALGRETQFIPSLDGKSFMPLGYRSSDLSKEEMSQLLEFMEAWAAENGVRFKAAPSQRDGR